MFIMIEFNFYGVRCFSLADDTTCSSISYVKLGSVVKSFGN